MYEHRKKKKKEEEKRRERERRTDGGGILPYTNNDTQQHTQTPPPTHIRIHIYITHTSSTARKKNPFLSSTEAVYYTSYIPRKMASRLAEDVFDRFDSKCLGYVDSKNLDDLVHILGLDLSKSQLEDARVVLSKRDEDKINREDFVEWYKDRDAELLRNRIKLLEREERKTLKRIAQANKRAAIVYNQKKNSTNKHDERRRYRENRQREIMAKHEHNSIRNELSRAAKLKSTTSVTERKWQNALDIKRRRREIEARKRDQDKTFQERARRYHNKIVEERRSQSKIKKERMQKVRKRGELAYLSKIVAERQVQHSKQKALSSMEKSEAKLIQRVENARMMQMEALESLSKIVLTDD